MSTQELATGSFRLSCHSEDPTFHRSGVRLWTLTFDMKGEKVNKLNQTVAAEVETLLSRLEELGKDGQVDALVLLSGKPGNFIAGADIEMIRRAKSSEEATTLSLEGQRLMNRWEDLPFPTVAGIEGAALGGGCEFALACSAMVMSENPSAKVGLPEVMLGLIPGSGGTIRLPRKIGLTSALDLILTGKSLSGSKALKLGLIEALLPKENFTQSVLLWTAKNLESLRSHQRLARPPILGGMGGWAGSLLESNPVFRRVVLQKARQQILAKTQGHYPAPLEALAVIQKTSGCFGDRLSGKARDEAMRKEAQSFGQLAMTEVSKNLIRLFFLTEGVKKSNGLISGKSMAEHPIHSAGVLGAGVMGGGIAQLFAEKNIQVRMKDLNTKALSLGVASANEIFKKQVKKKKITPREALQKLGRIAPVLDYSGFLQADLVVEAVVENLEVKKKVLAELETQVSQDCILASNTSSLSITEMQKHLKFPERVIGMHFFNPVSKMPLIEVIRGQQTSDSVVSAVFQLSKALGKTPIVVQDAPGFLVNRLLMPYLNEAVLLFAQGVPIPELDQALLRFGMPMGPMELIDEVGVDVGAKVSHILNAAFGSRMEPSPLNSSIVAAGRLGKKTGKGFYEYEGPTRKKVFNDEIYTILGVTPQPGKVSEEELVERCLLPMINEAARCLEEGVVATPEEVDLGMIMGTGFPPFRGGLLRYADSLGMKNLVNRLRHLETQLGSRFEPAPSLKDRAEVEQNFYAQG
ncbi:MAG: 3-hydroxyacyl-CoA dehydrogenase NAD-binding domain-containing protein [Bdellovibrionia bacterium]